MAEMAAVTRTLLPQNVNVVADGLHLPIAGSPPELVPDPLHELTLPNRPSKDAHSLGSSMGGNASGRPVQQRKILRKVHESQQGTGLLSSRPQGCPAVPQGRPREENHRVGYSLPKKHLHLHARLLEYGTQRPFLPAHQAFTIIG